MEHAATCLVTQTAHFTQQLARQQTAERLPAGICGPGPPVALITGSNGKACNAGNGHKGPYRLLWLYTFYSGSVATCW
jgi:hypothetical protein